MNAAPMVYECLRHQMLSAPAVLNHNCGARGDEDVDHSFWSSVAAAPSDRGFEDARRLDLDEIARESIALGLTP